MNKAPCQKTIVLEVTEDNMTCAAQRMLFRYWQSIKSEDRLPDWDHFDPAAVPQSLPEILLYDAQSNGSFFVSVIGQDCRNAMNVSASPRTLEEFMPPENYDDVKMRLEMVRDNDSPHLVRKNRAWQVDANQKTQEQHYTVLFLPFRCRHQGLTHKIINVLSF